MDSNQDNYDGHWVFVDEEQDYTYFIDFEFIQKSADEYTIVFSEQSFLCHLDNGMLSRKFPGSDEEFRFFLNNKHITRQHLKNNRIIADFSGEKVIGQNNNDIVPGKYYFYIENDSLYKRFIIFDIVKTNKRYSILMNKYIHASGKLDDDKIIFPAFLNGEAIIFIEQKDIVLELIHNGKKLKFKGIQLLETDYTNPYVGQWSTAHSEDSDHHLSIYQIDAARYVYPMESGFPHQTH